jgi:hypothetical protein
VSSPRLAVATLALLVLTACVEKPPGPGNYRWEGIHGFAIWPEDQPQDALDACEEKADEEPWRTDPEATAVEFVRSVLNWQRPPDLSDHEVSEAAPRTAFTMIDGSMPGWALGVVVHLRQLRECWFIAAVWPREGDISGRYRWVEHDNGYSLRAAWPGQGPINLEVGWGQEVRRIRLHEGESAIIPVPDPDLSGHILWFYDQPSDSTFGQPLSPPPRIP